MEIRHPQDQLAEIGDVCLGIVANVDDLADRCGAERGGARHAQRIIQGPPAPNPRSAGTPCEPIMKWD